MRLASSKPTAQLNSYDLLKLLALALMTLDHICMYLLPDALWLRAVGRGSFPIWLFLAGYGTPRLPSASLLGMGALVAAVEYTWQGKTLPLCILFSIAISRLMLWLMAAQRSHSRLTPHTLHTGLVACLFLALPTMLLWDYGTLALAFALLGHWHYQQTQAAPPHLLLLLWGVYGITQMVLFGFNAAEMLLMLAGGLPCALAMWRFAPHARQLPLSTRWRRLGHWLSRHSLYYYAGHLSLFIALGAWLKATI